MELRGGTTSRNTLPVPSCIFVFSNHRRLSSRPQFNGCRLGIVCFPLEGMRCLFQASSWNWNAHECVYDACILRGKRDPTLVKQVLLPSFFGRFTFLCICAHFHFLSHHHRRHHHNDSNGSNDNNQRQ